MKIQSASLALVVAMSFNGCGEKEHAEHGHDHAEKPLVVVPVPPYTGLVKRIAGDAVEIETLVGVGKDPSSNSVASMTMVIMKAMTMRHMKMKNLSSKNLPLRS